MGDKSLLRFIIAIILLIPIAAKSQDFPMLHYGMEEGLPSNRVYEAYRDSKGFLWIATDKGVARYNGIKFEKFTTDDGLSDNDIFFFQEDKQGRLWLGTGNGELCYYQGGAFHNPRNTPFLKLPFKTYYTAYISVEADSSITIGFSSQPFFINFKNNKYKTYNINNEYNKGLIKNSNIEVESYVQKDFFSDIEKAVKNKDNSYDIYFLYKRVKVDSNAKIIDIKKYPKGYQLVVDFGQNKRYFYDIHTLYSDRHDTIRKLKPGLYEDFTFFHMLHRFYVNEFFFVATDVGLYVNDTILLLKSKGISTITQDNIGNYWIGTLKYGLYYMDKDFFNTKFYENAYAQTVKYANFINGHLFFATSNNNLYSMYKDSVQCLFNYGKKYKQRTDAFNVPIYPNEPGYFINNDYKYYYFYYNENGIVDNIFNKQPAVRRYSLAFLVDGIKAIYEAGKNIYIQDRWRILKMDYNNRKSRDKVDLYSKDINVKMNNTRIFSSAQSYDGTIWYSSRDNMYKIIGDSSMVQPQLNGLSFSTFTVMPHYLVGCSLNNKIYICNNYEGKIAIDSVINQNCVWDKLYRLDSSHILISTNNNYRLLVLAPSPGKPRFEAITIENPIVPLQAEAITFDGVNCFFFKKGSITSISIKALLEKSVPPILSFTSLKINGRYVPVGNEYTIAYRNARNLTLSYSPISFSGKNISYQYTVSKTDNDNWGSINAEEINMANPSYGDYKVKVKAKTLSSEYSEPIVFTLHILKPFWATWWFIAICVLFTGGAIALITMQWIRAVINKREKEHGSKVKFMRSEYKALNALMNPHFIFNTLNNVQSLVNGNNKLAANEYLRIFADLIRQNMHNVSKELIPLQKEVDLVRNYMLLEKLRFEDKLEYAIHIDEGLELYNVMVSPLLIQPLVENSIKHGILPLKGRNGFIQINIFGRDNVLHIEIRDNGVGLNNAEARPGSLHQSYGLDNIKKRIEQLSMIQGKEMAFNMGEEAGGQGVRWTVVTITMAL